MTVTYQGQIRLDLELKLYESQVGQYCVYHNNSFQDANEQSVSEFNEFYKYCNVKT